MGSRSPPRVCILCLAVSALLRRLIVYRGMPHSAPVQDAALTTGAEWVQDLCEKLKEAFWQ
jgi:hypothetical protein